MLTLLIHAKCIGCSKSLLLVFCILVILTSNVHSQTKPKSTKKPAKPSVSATETKPFGYTIIDDLPPKYVGHNYGDVFRGGLLFNLESIKGEFEPTIDYEARMKRVKSRYIVGTTSFNDRFAFTFLPNADQFAMRYDPDIGALGLVLTWERRYEFGSYPGTYHSLFWSDTSKRIGSYIGRNAFNRSVRVSVYRNDTYYLICPGNVLERIDLFKKGFTEGKIELSIPMRPIDARKAKINLRVLVVGRLAEPAVFSEKSHDAPEISDPYDRYNFDYALNIAVEEIWIYDFETGNAYLKIGSSK